MRCFSKLFSSWLYYLPLVFLSFLLLTILNITNVFAVSPDSSISITSSSSSRLVTPSSVNSKTTGFCGYNYLIVSSSDSHDLSIVLDVRVGTFSYSSYFGSGSNNFSGGPSSFYLDLSNVTTNATSCYVQTNGSKSSTIVFDFYNDNPYSVPSGSISLTENGSFDVSSYAEAVVDVPPVMGDYHNDLVDIKRSIYVGSATLLVIYFFYCIYRMIIKGVKK